MSHPDTHSSWEWSGRTAGAIAVILVVGSLANSAGVGGGAIYIPILQALVGFGLKDATAVSQALIAAGSVVSVMINIFKRHPLHPEQPLINFQLALSFTPVVLMGVAIGVLLNTIFPAWLITILLLLLMAVMVVQSTGKACRLWKAETKAAAAQRAAGQAHRRELLLEQLSHRPELAHATAASLPLGMKVSHRPGVQYAGHYHSLPAYSHLPASVTWQGGTAGLRGFEQLPDDALQSLACLEGAAVDSSSYQQFAAPARVSQPWKSQAGQGARLAAVEDKWLSYDSMEGQDYQGVTTRQGSGHQDLTRQQSAAHSPAFHIGSAPTAWQGRLPTAAGSQLPMAGSSAYEQMRAPLLQQAQSSIDAESQHVDETRKSGFFARGISSRSARLNHAGGYEQLSNLTDGLAWEGRGSDALGSIAEHGAAAAGLYNPRAGRSLPVRKDEQSWLTRRSRWRTLMLQDLGGELGSVPPQQSLLARAQTLHLSERASGAALHVAATAPSAAIPSATADTHICIVAEARSQPAMQAHGVQGVQGTESLRVLTSSAARDVAALQAQSKAGGSRQQQLLEEIMSGPRVSRRLPPVLPPLDDNEVAEILHHAGERSVPRMGRPPGPLFAALQDAVNKAHNNTAASAAAQPVDADAHHVQPSATPFAAAAGIAPTGDQHVHAIASQDSGPWAGPAQHEATATSSGVQSSFTGRQDGMQPPSAPSLHSAQHTGRQEELIVPCGPVHIAKPSEGPTPPLPSLSQMHIAQSPAVTKIAHAHSPSERLLRVAPIHMHATFLRARSLSSSDLVRMSQQHRGGAAAELFTKGDEQVERKRTHRTISAGDVARLPMSAAQLAVNVCRVMALDLANLPWRLIAGMAALWLVFSGLQVARSLVLKCSPAYWALLSVQLALMLSFSTVLTLYSRRRSKQDAVSTGQGDYKPVADKEANAAVTANGVAVVGDRTSVAPWPVAAEPASAAALNRGGGATPNGQEVLSNANDITSDGHIVLECSDDVDGKQLTSVAGVPGGENNTKPSMASKANPAATDANAVVTPASASNPPAGANIIVLAVAALAGLVGGLLGLGGGMLIGPLLLEIGIHPQTGAATSSLMVLFSSTAALVGFVVLHRLNVQYSLVLGAASAIASILGVVIVSDLVRRTGRTSLVVFMLSGFMLLALGSIAGFGITNMIDQFKSGDAIHFNSICS